MTAQRPETAETIIIGAGSAECVIARRLVDAGRPVTLIEAGSDDANPHIDHLSTLGMLWHSDQDWDYYTTPQPGAAGRRIHLPRGRVMGGSHALNAGIWVRGDRWDYDTWSHELGCEGWSWEEVLPVFRKIENYDGGASGTRGGEGPLDVVVDFPRNPLMEDLVEACRETGLPLNPDYNSGTVDGVSRMQLTIRDGHRFNTWRAYLKPIVGDPRLSILTDVQVRRILFEGRRAVGVEVEGADGVRELSAERVVLAAGALNSPEILLRSGVGPGEELREVGIEPVHDLPGVGRNLHDHLLSPVVYTTEGAPVPAGEVTVAEVHFFDRSDPGLPAPDTQPIFFSVPMYAAIRG